MDKNIHLLLKVFAVVHLVRLVTVDGRLLLKVYTAIQVVRFIHLDVRLVRWIRISL